ncbi:MAG: hypothetical protein IT585_00660 [candidate division Zixibacteria bacterium]|nr:hypothetical protein [candidate division Zixibacteria bacterium]
MKYEDLDCDGVHDPGEPGLANWIICTTDYYGTFCDTTDATGAYAIYGLASTYLHFVYETQQPGWIQTAPSTIQYNVYQPLYNSIMTGYDFGNLDTSKCAAIAYDTCVAGKPDHFQPDAPELPTPSPALQTFLAELCQGAPNLAFDQPAFNQCFGHTFNNCFDTSCCVVSATLCLRLMGINAGCEDDDLQLGDYPGTASIYHLSLSQLLGIHTAGADTIWNPGDTMTVCLDLANLPPYGFITSVMPLLQDGKIDFLLHDDTMIDFLRLEVGRCCPGAANDCSISGRKWNDYDRDGVHDPGEPGLGGWTIELYYQGGPLYASTTTAANGAYAFTNLPCTTFTVVEVNQPNWVQTYPSPSVHNLTLGSGTNQTNIDFGNFMCSDNPADTCCARVPGQMIAWYSFDETAPATAFDLAGGDNPGTHLGTFSFGPGQVNGAYRFGPTLANQDIVRVYSDPFVTVAGGDFSADAWIHPTSFSANCSVFLTNPGNAPCVDPIFDNRQWFFGGSGLDGVCFFVKDDGQGTNTGNLGLVMSSFPTPQTTFMTPPGVVALNQWQHVAVTVSRSTGVGTFYLNGVVVGTFTPIAGPLFSTNAGPILDIGHGTFLNTGSCYLTNRYFDGWIDELELFNRALAQSEVQSLYAAGSSGKCRVHCKIPSMLIFCKGQNTKILNLTICNDGASPATINYSLAGMASGSGCNVSGIGFTFSPANGTTPLLAPGQCITIPITVTRPFSFVAGNIACFSVSIIDPVTGASSTCSGKFVAPGKWCFIAVEPNFPSPLRVGQPQAMLFNLLNDEDSSGILRYRINALDDHGELPSGIVSLNGLPPGEPVLGQRSISLGSTDNIQVELALTEFEALTMPTILFSVDDDNDGVYDPIGAGAVQPLSIVDCNGNGVDDLVDIGAGTSLDANGNGVPDDCEAVCNAGYCSRCYICGDADASGAVTISDAVYLINYIFAGGAPPNPVLAGDADCSNQVTISDAVFLINYIFAGGARPCAGCP